MLVGRVGLEPRTQGLSDPSGTTWVVVHQEGVTGAAARAFRLRVQVMRPPTHSTRGSVSRRTFRTRHQVAGASSDPALVSHSAIPVQLSASLLMFSARRARAVLLACW